MRPLTRKERRLALAAGTILLITFIYNSLISPALQRIETLQRVSPEKQQQWIDITQTAYQVEQCQKQLDDLRQTLDDQPSDFSPKAWLENMVRQSNLSEQQTTLTHRQRPLDDHYTQTTLTLELKQK